MSDKSIEDRIKDYNNLDEKSTVSELLTAINEIEHDIKYSDYKRHYWSDLYSSLRQLRNKLAELKSLVKNICELCHEKDEEEMLRTLPDGRRVCKKCWKIETDSTILQKFRESFTIRSDENE